MNDLSTAYWLGFSRTACRTAMSAMLVFERVVVTATRLALGRTVARSRAAILQFAAALALHRHGTWLVLFAILFTGLWLLAGWIGVGNGLPRGLLIGIATPLLVNALFPLKQASR